MPAETFSRELVVPADLPRCWSTITDFEQVSSWVGILKDVDELEPLQNYEAVLEDRLGPFRLRADLEVTISNVEFERSLHVFAEGEDRQVGSQIKIDGDLQFEPAADGTKITISGEYEVTGRVATLGAAMITTKAQKIIDEFFENTERALT